MRRASRRAPVLALLCIAIVIAACSSSSSDDGGGGPGSDIGEGGVGIGNEGGAVPEGDATRPPEVDASSITPPSATCTAPITAANVSAPTAVVGSGTAASCTEAALTTALTAGGIVTFSCGASPVTITVTKTIELPTDKDTVIDGGGKITLDGGGKVRILEWNHLDFRVDMHVLTLQHLTLAHGHIAGTDPYLPAPAPCSTGFYDGSGGGLHVRDGVLHVIDSTFLNNEAEKLGPDVGGGAIYLDGAVGAVIVGSTFLNNSGSNSGAIGALNSDLDVYNSHFEGNSALGFGANSDDATKCMVIAAKTNQHQAGSGGNAGAVGIDGGADTTHTFCGVVFKNNHGGASAVGGALGRTPDMDKQTTVIDRCLFDSNTADDGAAVYFHNSNLTITASTFNGNMGKGSGCVQADLTTVDFTNVTFYGNHSTTSVGATLSLFDGSTGTLLNCTFAKNVCDAPNMFGAAIFGAPNLTIQNTIFDANTGQNPGAPMQCQVGTVTGAGNVQFPKNHVNGGGADALCAPGIDESADPAVGALGDHGGPVPTALVAAGSPALAKGTGCPATDARGHTRTAASCTAGATEGTN
jgi:hypothetical protein